MTDDEDDFDRLLTAHLREQLDPHVGGARAAFEQRPPSLGWSVGRWSVAAAVLIGSGVGLSLAWEAWPGRRPPTEVVHGNPPSGGHPAAERRFVSTWTETVDEGLVVLDGRTPARQLRRLTYEQTRFQDRAGAWQVSTRVPNEDLILVDWERD